MSSESNEINRQATEWLGKRSFRELTPEERVEFEGWLAADSRHLGAYGMAEAALARVQYAFGEATLDTASLAISSALGGQPAERSKWSRRRLLVAGGAAASVAGLGLTTAALWGREEVYSTALGQVREFRLSDGSTVVLNTNSRITVRYTAMWRAIKLEQGEARFDVAKNKYRPFTVAAGGISVRAVGTSFVVSAVPMRPLQVLVREGIVDIARSGEASLRAGANARVIAASGAAMVSTLLADAQLTRALAWQYGRIVFDNQTLQSAADEYARYSDVRIIVDPAVAHRKITGFFASNDPIGFAKVAAAVLQLQVEVSARSVKIFGRQEGAR